MLLSSCATWDREEKILEYTYLTAQVVDYLQSTSITRHDNPYDETNIILGKTPSLKELQIYNAITFIAHPIVSDFLKSHRKKWQYFTLGLTLSVVIENYQIGLRVDL